MISHEVTTLIITFIIILGVYISHKVTERKLLQIEQKIEQMYDLMVGIENSSAQVPVLKKQRGIKKFLSSDLSSLKDEEAVCPIDKEDKPVWLK